MHRKILCLILLYLLAGCSAFSHVEPTSGPVAKVRFLSDSPNLVIVWAYQDSSCNGESEWMRLRNGPLLISTPKGLDIPLNAGLNKNSYMEFFVAADKEHTFIFKEEKRTETMVYSCGVPVKVKFDSKEMYELSYHQGTKNCSVNVNEIKKNASGEYRHVKIDEFTNRVYGFGEECIKSFYKMRLY